MELIDSASILLVVRAYFLMHVNCIYLYLVWIFLISVKLGIFIRIVDPYSYVNILVDLCMHDLAKVYIYTLHNNIVLYKKCNVVVT